MSRNHRTHDYNHDRADRHANVRNYLILALILLSALVGLAIWFSALAQAQPLGVTALTDPIILTQAQPTGLNAFGNFGMQMLGFVLSGATAIITGYAGAWLNRARIFQANQDQSLSADRLSNVILRGIDFATTTTMNEVAKKGSGQTEFKYDNMFLALVSAFVRAGAPALLETFNLTGDHARLNNMIMARLPVSGGIPAISGAISTSAAVKDAQDEGRAGHFELPVETSRAQHLHG